MALDSWKKSAVSLTLDALNIWSSEVEEKLRYSYAFSSELF